MLFGNRFEKALISEYIISPFNGYSINKNTAFIDLLLDFCSSVAHNGVVFPNGISKQDQTKVLYSSFALGIILACSKNESQSGEISGGATRAFARTAKQNGMSQQQILEKLSCIMDYFDSIGKEIDSAAPEKQGAYAAMGFLSQVGVKPSKDNIYAMYSLYDRFFEAYTKWDQVVNSNNIPAKKKNEKPQAEQIFDLMDSFLSSFLRNFFSGRGTTFSIGVLFGIANAVYLLTAEKINADNIVESDITVHTVDALHLNRYSDDTIDSIMNIRHQVSSEYYQKGSGMPISQFIDGVANELVEYFGKSEKELDYASVRSSLFDYQQEIVSLLGAEDKE